MAKQRYKASKQINGVRYWANGWTQAEADQKLAAKLANLELNQKSLHSVKTSESSDRIQTLTDLAETVWYPSIIHHTKSTKQSYISSYRANIGPKIGSLPYAQIRNIDVQAWVNELLHIKSQKTVRVACSVLRQIFEVAILNDLVSRNPCERIKFPKKPPKRERYLSPADLANLISQAPPDLKNAVILGGLFGLRLGECLALRWIDIEKDRIRVSRSMSKYGEGPTKTDATRDIHLPSQVKRTLEENGKTDCPYVCSSNGKQMPQSTFARKLKAWGGMPENFTFHDLRHVAAFLLSPDPRGAQRVLGHAVPNTTELYIATRAESTIAIVETVTTQVMQHVERK